VTPNAATTKTVSIPGNADATKTQGSVQHTVSALGTDPVPIALVNPTDITTDSNGTATFKSTGGNAQLNAAAQGYISVVNGVGNGTAQTATATPIDGQVTFTVDSATAGSGRAVVFSMKDANTNLAADAKGAPTEAFGLGGAITWIPKEASAGAITAADVTSVDKANGYIVAGGSTYKYKSGDQFQLFTPEAAAFSRWWHLRQHVSGGLPEQAVQG
jgi:hypothetical protein